MIDERIAQANKRLKAARVGVSIERRGGTLWLRGTLPPKPGSGKTEPFRQKHALGVKASPAGLQHAEGQARLMGAELQLGKFDWSNWLETQPQVETGTVGDWIANYEQD
ncbi:MAG: integrase, partial [Cyanobacteria bacterium Co-bin8]|nr:integrase [Cyanobacteria bacterium Co-bin8]